MFPFLKISLYNYVTIIPRYAAEYLQKASRVSLTSIPARRPTELLQALERLRLVLLSLFSLLQCSFLPRI
ncbi:hypothetical protein [Streptococcus pyogenes]|uniref:hypothetical protein n=1 Tax=Streptococcus pyogenes TaxID=1314 RepID=UPI00109D676F|nr:hypothetical protein [Streptococcus pyogenes]